MMACLRCEARGKTWRGGDPQCAFRDGKFVADNWNCATMNGLRELVGDVGFGNDQPALINGRPQAFGIRWADDSWGAINIIDVRLERDHYKTLWLSWYKNRGRTDAALLLNDHGSEVPTYEDCDAILNHFKSLIAPPVLAS